GKAIGFDMGGTSTDVCRFDGEFERRYEMEVNDPESGAGVRIVAPMLWIETVAAGGGSVCRFDGQKPVVGPGSAGADPGPACYGRGGPLTVTDVNLLLGRLAPDRFPFPLDEGASARALDAVAGEIASASGVRYGREELAEGFVRIANANMAAPIRKLAVRKGLDVREYAMVCFGGAGGQHACAVARALGIPRVLVPRLDGALSALGIGTADVRRFGERHVGRPLTAQTLAEIEPAFRETEERLRREVAGEGIPDTRILPPRRLLDLRYKGQSVSIAVPAPADGAWRRAFEEAHLRHYGFVHALRGVEIQAFRVEATGRGEPPPPEPTPPRRGDPRPLRAGALWSGGRRLEAPVFGRDDLAPGDRIEGPALILGRIATAVVDPGFRAEVLATGDLLLEDALAPADSLSPSSDRLGARPGDEAARRRGEAEPVLPLPPGEGRGEGGEPPARKGERAKGRLRDEDPADPDDPGPPCDPITLEIFNNQFASIAEQMGVALQRTALSTNVKERLDFSCALFDERGELVVNAPHIPVHLGGMSDCVKRLVEDAPSMKPGDVFVTNDPYRGGSHLPDVTVITPVFDTGGTGEITNPKSQIPTKSQSSNFNPDAPDPAGRPPRILFFTASRAHHAEIGGIAPGSMPPSSRTLGEEGVLIGRFRLVDGSRPSEERLEALLASGPYPSRAPAENLADVHAQAAANRLGARLLLEMAGKHGRGTVRAYMGHIRAAAARAMRGALGRFEPGEYRFEDRLDDGTPLRVRIEIGRGSRGAEAVVDFTGTGPVLVGNLNANASIVSSVVLFCLRCLIPGDIPLNGGVLEPVRIVLPECFLNPRPAPDGVSSPAVAGGNVETSQRIADALFGALRVVAAGQGTMNNLTFGNDRFQYYETIAGGSGAGPDFDGADAVHVHMTNTRITDPEVLEARCPVRLRRFAIRRGSGGRGRRTGGDGVVREIEFLEPVEVSLLTQRRLVAPYGMEGGGDGKPGRNRFLPAGGPERELPPIGSVKAGAGDVLVIETPGGGGWGRVTFFCA
ncbi:MAG: hydantoinase B/oxoprolinase family protein, partial [Planctomycetes bacterium]|nr:hydantoinase B/oxoprolinase family protein [Planctomycetota bacterium]